MNPFEPTGPEVPIAPIDIPTPEIPPANFTTIGGMLAAGAAAAKGGKYAFQWLLDLIAKIVGVILTALIGIVEQFVLLIITAIFKAWNGNEQMTSQISAAALSGILGVPIAPGDLGGAGNAAGRPATNAALVDAITTAMGGPFIGGSATAIAPSATGANKFLGMAMNMAVEGWLQGWLADCFSYHELERFGDLKDILEKSLGIGRLSHQALRPPMKIFVRDPFTHLLNGTYHPTLLPLATALKEYTRGTLSYDLLTPITDALGIPQENLPAIINDLRPHVAPLQLANLVRTGQIDTPTAIAELKAFGYDDPTANWVLAAEDNARLIALAQQYVAAAEAAMVSRHMDVATFDGIVDAFTNTAQSFNAGVGFGAFGAATVPIFTPAEAALVKSTAYLKRLHGMQLPPIGIAQQLLDVGLIGIDEFSTLLTLHGYTNGEATADQWSADVDAAIDFGSNTSWSTWWELYATKKAIDYETAQTAKADALKARQLRATTALMKAQAKAAAATADAEAKGVSIAKFETLVLDGLKTIAQYQAFLAMKGLAPDNVAAFTTILEGKLATKTGAATATGLVVGGSKAKGLSLAQLEAAVREGFLSPADFATELVALGYTADAAAVVGEELQNSIAAAKLKASSSAAAAAALGQRKVSLAQEETAVALGLQTLAQYEAMLTAAGFDPADVAILSAEAQAKVTAAQAAAKKKLASSGAPGTKPLAIAELEKLVRAGIRPISDYETALTDAGYDAADVASQMTLLNHLMVYDQHQAAAAGRSSALQTTGGLSLSQVRTAVKLGIVPIAVYDQALTAAGTSSSDAAVLHASLIAELVARVSTAAAVKRVNTLLEAQGFTLASLEDQVLAGTLTPVAFQANLVAAGVLPADVADLAALVTDKLANAAATGQLVAVATAAAAAKSLSLAEAAAAVKAGLKDIVWYQSFVSGLGFDAADTAILVALEAAKVGVAPPPPIA